MFCRHDSFCDQTLFSNSQEKNGWNLFLISEHTFLDIFLHITCTGILLIQIHPSTHPNESCQARAAGSAAIALNSELTIGGFAVKI